MATPEQCRTQLKAERKRLLESARRGEINASCVDGIIEARAREAARHNGVPQYWREYLPKLEL